MVQNSAVAVSASNQSNQKWQAGRHEFLCLSLEKKMKKLCMQIAYIYIHGKKQQNTVRFQPPTRDEGNSQTWAWKQYHQT
jgi:hypothetical protein